MPQDYAQAAEWYRKAADQGIADAEYNLGVAVFQRPGRAAGLCPGRRVVPQGRRPGRSEAQTNLGLLYDHGQGVPQDYAQAARWYRMAADQGNADAPFISWRCSTDNGQGVPQDYAQAAQWYRKAADQGNAVAQNNLGVLYAHGQGVPQDDAQAARWYRKAADQGNARAQVNLAFAYDTGTGIEQNETKARELLHEAVEEGDESAKRLEQQLLANDQSAAQRSSSSANDDGWKYLLGAVGAAVLLDAVVGGSSSDSAGSDSSDEDNTYDYGSDRESANSPLWARPWGYSLHVYALRLLYHW